MSIVEIEGLTNVLHRGKINASSKRHETQGEHHMPRRNGMEPMEPEITVDQEEGVGQVQTPVEYNDEGERLGVRRAVAFAQSLNPKVTRNSLLAAYKAGRVEDAREEQPNPDVDLQYFASVGAIRAWLSNRGKGRGASPRQGEKVQVFYGTDAQREEANHILQAAGFPVQILSRKEFNSARQQEEAGVEQDQDDLEAELNAVD